MSFELRNTGSVKGSEAPQVYVGPPSSPPPLVQFAFRKLAGFERVELGAGEGKRVRIQVSRRELSYWSTALQRWILPGGERTVYVGASSQDLRLQVKAATRVPWWGAWEYPSPIAPDATLSR